MDIGMIGLGRMGLGLSERLVRAGHTVFGYDKNASVMSAFVAKGGRSADSLARLAESLTPPRVAWLMVPPGRPVDDTLESLIPHLAAGDVLIDGGNSYYKDTMRRAASIEKRGLHYVDVGTSGGVWGARRGFSLMVGGPQSVIKTLRPIFESLAPAKDEGWGYLGPSGAGHFVKMVHNAIEYGLMQAYAEGFSLLERKRELDLDLGQVADIWRSASVIRSWLLDLMADALRENPTLAGVAPFVADSGEGRWAVAEALDAEVPAPVITSALFERLRSRETNSFADRLLAVTRNKFGGHAVTRKE